MPTENPYETPQASGIAPDHRRLRKRAKVVFSFAVACCVLGVGLMGSSSYVRNGPSRRLAARLDSLRPDSLSPREVLNDIARTAPIADLLWYMGVPLAAIGGLAAVRSGILCFSTRNTNENRAKDLQ